MRGIADWTELYDGRSKAINTCVCVDHDLGRFTRWRRGGTQTTSPWPPMLLHLAATTQQGQAVDVAGINRTSRAGRKLMATIHVPDDY